MKTLKWVGWLAAAPGTIAGGGDAEHLRSLGIDVPKTGVELEYDDFYVEMDEATFERLDPHWGRYVWTLEPREA